MSNIAEKTANVFPLVEKLMERLKGEDISPSLMVEVGELCFGLDLPCVHGNC